MKEHPIIFSTAMVKAILDGRKTMARRVVKPQPHEEEYLEAGNYTPALIDKDGEMYPADYQLFGAYTSDGEYTWKCPYGQVGDRLWVRETFGIDEGDCSQPVIFYKAETDDWGGRWKPSIFMPHWASRITLEITEVRVERLQEISEEDMRQEGCVGAWGMGCEEVFCKLWDSLNAKRGYGWDTNPWCWVIGLRKDKG